MGLSAPLKLLVDLFLIKCYNYVRVLGNVPTNNINDRSIKVQNCKN